MAPQTPSNHITVELQLLQDKNVQLLEQFGKDWKAGADLLLTDLKEMLERRGGTAVVAGGESASTAVGAGEATEGALRARQGGSIIIPRTYNSTWDDSGLEITQTPSGGGPSIAASVSGQGGTAIGTDTSPPPRQPPKQGMLHSIFGGEHADALYATVGTQVAQMFGGSQLMGGVVGGLFGTRAQQMGWKKSLPLAMTGMMTAKAVQGAYPMVLPFMQPMAASMMGADLGYDTYGWGGLPIGSDAWKFSLSEQWDAYQESRLRSAQGSEIFERIPLVGGAIDKWGGRVLDGMERLPGGRVARQLLRTIGPQDPHYTSRDADEARALTRAYGWGGKGEVGQRMQDIMVNYMVRMKRKFPTVQQETMMKLMEPVRYGTGTFEGAAAAINAMTAAAQGAHFAIKEFEQKVNSAAMSLSESTGIPYQRAHIATSAFTAATGRDPSMLAGFMANDRGGYLSMSMTGKDFYQTFYGNKAPLYAMQGTMAVLGELGSPEYWQSIKDDPAAKREALNMLAIYHKRDPSLLGNMSPDEFSQMLMEGGDPLARMEGGIEMTHATTRGNRVKALKTGGMSADVIDAYKRVTSGETKIGGSRWGGNEALKKFVGDPTTKKGQQRLGQYLLATDRDKFLKDKLDKRENKKEKMELLIRLQPGVKEIFDFVKNPGGRASTNTNRGQARPSASWLDVGSALMSIDTDKIGQSLMAEIRPDNLDQ